jgi:hypothetical protein
MHVGKGRSSNGGLKHSQFIGVWFLKLFAVATNSMGSRKVRKDCKNIVAKPTKYFSDSTRFNVGAF